MSLGRFLSELAAFRKNNPEPATRFRAYGLDLRDANLAEAGAPPLNDVDFVDCDAAGADFSGLSLENTHWTNCHLGGARFRRAKLQWARFLGGTDLERVDFSDALALGATFKSLRNESFEYVTARGANFADADFHGTRLSHADFSGAVLTRARGYVLDATRVYLTDFSAHAPDPWSKLRRTYTGPWFTINLLFLIVFLLSLLVRAFEFHIFAVLERTPAIGASFGEICKAYPERCVHVSLIQVLLAYGRDGFAHVFLYTALLYNVLRAFMTLTVAGLREQEERSFRSPAYKPSKASLRAEWLQYYGWMKGPYYCMKVLWCVMVVCFAHEAWALFTESVMIFK